jgi:hypothetical protein
MLPPVAAIEHMVDDSPRARGAHDAACSDNTEPRRRRAKKVADVHIIPDQEAPANY